MACIFGAIALTYGVLAIFFPKSLAKAFDKVDSYALSVHYYEKQYNKSGMAEDLFALCIKANAYTDSVRAQKYLEKFIALENFDKYCEKLDENSSSRVTIEELLEGKLVCATFINLGLTDALQKAKQMVSDEYSSYNPFFMLYTDGNFSLNQQQLESIKSAILEIAQNLSDNTFALADVNALENIINQ